MTNQRDDLCFTPVPVLGRMLRAGTHSACDLTEAFLSRIEQVDRVTRSYALITQDTARREAEDADAAFRRGIDRGPMHGIPVALKDLVDTAGAVTAAGMGIHANRVPVRDATVVSRLRAAGAIILGKLTLTEGATMAHHADVAAPLNPWDHGRDPGFSSSGSGVAVAAGLCAVAMGSDTGGSIRIPSAYNGVTGLKPTWGRVSRYGVFPLVDFLDVIGPMARSAAGAAACLSVIAGGDPLDPTCTTRGIDSYADMINGSVSMLCVGVDWARIEEDCEPAVVAGLHHAADVLNDLGVRLRPVRYPVLDLDRVMPLFVAAMADAHRETYPARAAEYGEGIRALIDRGLATTGPDIAKAIALVCAFRAETNTLFSEVDLLLTPSLTGVAPRVGHAIAAARKGGPMSRHSAYTLPFNFAGNPTITFPTGFVDGLPVSAQLVGPGLSEAILLRTCDAFQRVTDWHAKRPPAAAPTSAG